MRALTTTLFALTLLGANVPAQNKATAQRLARAVLIEEQEGDLKAAERAYRALLADESANRVHAKTSFRLGLLLWRLDRREEAKPWLDRAAAAGRELADKVAALKAEDSEAAEAARRLQARGKALVERYVELLQGDHQAQQEQLQIVRREMQQLPEPSARAIAFHLRQRRALQADDSYLRIAKWLIHRLWTIGTQPAVEYLSETIETDPIAWQRVIAERGVSAARQQGGIPTELLAVAKALTRVPDPTREVWTSAFQIIDCCGHALAIECLAAEHPATALAGLQALRRFVQKPATWQAPFFANHGDRIVAYASSTSPRHREAAWILLTKAVREQLDGSLPPLLRALKTAPETAPELSFGFNWRTTDNDTLATIAGTATALGPIVEAGPTNAQKIVARLVDKSNRGWNRGAWPAIAELLRLGYAGHTSDEWLAIAYHQGKADVRAKIVRRLVEIRQANSLLRSVRNLGIPQELFPAVREVVAACAAPRQSIDWSPKPGSLSTKTAGGGLSILLEAAGRSGHPEAAAWLAEQIDVWPSELEQISKSLILLSRSERDAAAGLRRLLTLDAPRKLDADVRAQIFYELARIGDEPSIALLSRAWELGLKPKERINQSLFYIIGTDDADAIADRFRKLRTPRRTNPVDVLAPVTPKDRPFWIGYDEPQLARAWNELLTGSASDSFWRELIVPTGSRPNPVLPVLALPQIIRMLDQRGDDLVWNSGMRGALAEATKRVTGEQLAGSEPIRQALRQLLHLEPRLASQCFSALERSLASQFADVAREQLQQTGATEWLYALTRQEIELGVDAWRAALRGTNTLSTLNLLPPGAPKALQVDVTELLSAQSHALRVAACQTIARAFPDEAPAAILPLLRDPEAEVRDAARKQLDLLREAREQRQFWANVTGGVDLSPQATSQKLVQQAMPDQETSQRVLAIRSLAAVGATEALPLLIEWSQDAKTAAAVRSAASKAINALLARSEAGK